MSNHIEYFDNPARNLANGSCYMNQNVERRDYQRMVTLQAAKRNEGYSVQVAVMNRINVYVNDPLIVSANDQFAIY